MQVVDGRLILSPTDLVTYLGCAHATALDLEVAQGLRARPAPGVDDQLAFIADRGLAHERAYLQRLRDEGRSIAEIPRQADPVLAERATVAAMRSGVDVIYQATFFDGTWLGYADFLLRREHPGGSLGGWVYDVADTKLARHLSAASLLQLATYARRLELLQGVPPEQVLVITGEGLERPWPLADVSAYAARARAGFERHLAEALRADSWAGAAPERPEAVPVAGCARCRWQEQCSTAWHAADDLSLVAGMRRAHRAALRDAGIRDVAALADAGPEGPEGITVSAYQRLRRQAKLQVRERQERRPVYELLPPTPGRGLARLPAPDAGDLYLDFEGDPFAGACGREYLAGVLDREDRFRTWWAHDEAAEADMVAGLLDFLMERWRLYPGLHVYHYAPYETAALKRLTGRHGVGEAELDALLRGRRFVDLYAVVKQGMLIGKSSYSLKKLEDFYWGHIRRSEGEEVSDALSSVVEYERWLGGGGDDILARIADYNREDVRSTLALHDWLEDRRDELLAVDPAAAAGLVRPVHASVAEADESEAASAERALAQRLLDLGDELLAGLVGWHRREDRPEWWEFFRRADMADDELVEDAAAVGRLGDPVQAGERHAATGRVTSRFWRYAFPPQQARLELGRAAYDVDTRQACGTVVALDTGAGEVLLSRRAGDDPAHPRGLMPPGPINAAVLRDAVARQAELRLAGSGRGLPSAGLALLDAVVPSDLALRPGEAPTDAVVRVGLGLDGDVLAVQGPPGAGKTYAASHLIRALLDAGRRVGVTAQSHAVIRNLLREVGRPAVHKVTGEPRRSGDATCVVEVADNGAVRQALADGEANLVGGTAWLWARPEFDAAVDVLVIDEAGQFSLANALAVAGAARSLVLLGDPQQLTQPTKADHPGGAGVSALGHLLGEHEVIPAGRGLFLDVTYRMHPAVTAFVSQVSYEGRLRAAPGRERQRVDAPGALTGAGLRHVAVAHDGNGQDSPQEAAVVADLVRDLLQGRWTDSDGSTQAMTPADVLVVAPYNAQVRRLTAAVPAGVRVGTVDAFQGQQAPVVIYSTASSSASDAPRGLSFLYDVHRLNVAVSRAKALAVWVGSPALFDAAPGTAEEVRLVNALCAFEAAADTIVPAARRPEE